MNTQLARIVMSLGLAAVIVAGCQGQPDATPTALPEPGFKPSPTPASEAERVIQGIGSTMQDLLETQAMTGCSLAVVAPGEDEAITTKYYGFGTISKDDTAPADKNTIYEIGGLSKLFTATALAVEINNKTLDLSTPAQAVMPSPIVVPDYQGRALIISELATNTSGLPHRAQGIGGNRKINGVIQQGYASNEEMAGYLEKVRLSNPPGSTWDNSNTGYGMLGLAIAQVRSKTYEQVVLDDVSEPLGLEHTRVVLTDEEMALAAQGYTASRENASPFATEGGFLGAAGLRSSIADLAVFLQASILADGTPIDGAIQFTQQVWADGPDPAVSQGIGWLISNAGRPDQVYFKGGETQGFSAYIAFSKEKKTGYVVACNAPSVEKAVPALNALLLEASTPIDESENTP